MSEKMEDDLSYIRGLYVGQLDSDEMTLFAKAIDAGLAFRNYDHPGGILGLAKVGVYPSYLTATKETP
jgi:hypothetical protein